MRIFNIWKSRDTLPLKQRLRTKMGLIHCVWHQFIPEKQIRDGQQSSLHAFPVFFAAVYKKHVLYKKLLLRQEYKGAQIPNTVPIKLRKYSLVYCILKYFPQVCYVTKKHIFVLLNFLGILQEICNYAWCWLVLHMICFLKIVKNHNTSRNIFIGINFNFKSFTFDLKYIPENWPMSCLACCINAHLSGGLLNWGQILSPWLGGI